MQRPRARRHRDHDQGDDDRDRQPLDERVTAAFEDLQGLYREAQEWQEGLKAELAEADKLVARIERFMHNPPDPVERDRAAPVRRLDT